MINTSPKHATTGWRKFPEYGAYFRLDDGTLRVSRMRDDGSREDRSLKVVDWKTGSNAKHGATINRIVAELLDHSYS